MRFRSGLLPGWSDHDHGGRNLPVAAARLRRLEGAPRMELAIGQSRHLRFAAEMKVRVLGIADGWLEADGKRIYTVSDMRVGLFKPEAA